MQKDRPNPKGLSRDQGSSQIEKIGDGRWRLFAVNPTDTPPTREEKGQKVKDWSAVHVVWTSDQYASSDVIYARVRPWRYFSTGPKPVASGTREGIWIPDFEIEVALTAGAINTSRSSHYVWETRGAEKMFWQILQIVNPNDADDLEWTQEQVYGYMREDNDAHAVVVNSPNAGDGGGIQEVIVLDQVVPIAREDTIYSNAWGEFVAEYSNATTILLHDLPFPLDASMILGVVIKTPGAINETMELYRGSGLSCSYTPGTGALVLGGGFSLNSGDDIVVYIEGPPKSLEEGPDGFMYRRTKSMNPDSKLVTLDGNIQKTLAEGSGVVNIPFNMAQDGLHFLSLHHNIGGDAYVTIEGTNDLDRDGSERWDDITQQVTGFTQLDVTTPDVIPPQSWVGYRRIQFVLNPGESGGAVALYITRSAYGALWNPQAYEAEVLQLAGPQVMGEPRSVQADALTEGEAGRFVQNLYKELVLANYIWATQANRTEEDDPIDTRDVPDVSIDGGALAEGTTYHWYIDMAHMKFLSIHWDPADANNTVTIEASDQDDGTAPNACNYYDVGTLWFGAASWTAEFFHEADTPTQVKWVHIQLVRAGAPAGASTHDLFTRKCY